MVDSQKNIALLVVVGLCSFVAANAQNGQLRKGDKRYDQQNYSAAEAAYREAVAGPVASYNAGNAAYQQGKFTEAIPLYRNAGRTATDPSAKADALFNMGNALLRAGQYADAIQAYENSLRLHANLADAKKNLQIAIQKLREQQEPPPPLPPPPPPPPPPPKQRPRNNYLDQATAGRKREVPAGGLSPEAARSLLETQVTKQEQANAQQYRQLAPAVRPSRVKKDW